MKSPKIINFKKFTKTSGKLLPITFNNKFPINVKRIFVIYGKKKYKRGDHAHKKCSQIFIPLMGEIKINMKYKDLAEQLLKCCLALRKDNELQTKKSRHRLKL